MSVENSKFLMYLIYWCRSDVFYSSHKWLYSNSSELFALAYFFSTRLSIEHRSVIVLHRTSTVLNVLAVPYRISCTVPRTSISRLSHLQRDRSSWFVLSQLKECRLYRLEIAGDQLRPLRDWTGYLQASPRYL